MGTLTLNLGIRYDYEPGSANAGFQSAYPFILSTKEDRTQFSPRLGFAWDPRGDGRSVVRGGFGLSDFQLYNNLAQDQEFFNGTTYKIAEFDLFGGPELLRQEQPAPTPRRSRRRRRSSERWPPTSRPPTRSSPPSVTSGSWAAHGRWAPTSSGSGVSTSSTSGTWNVSPNQYWPVLYPEVGRIRQIASDASSDYKALEITVQRRPSSDFSMQLAYTYSKAINETDGFYIPIPDSAKPISFQEGPAMSDQRHRLVLNGTYNLPLGFQVSGIWKLGSGQPWNAEITGGDTNGDGVPHDRLPGDARNNQLSNTYSRVDLRLAKLFKLGKAEVTLIGEIFNLFNRRNYDPGGVGHAAGGYTSNRCRTSELTPAGQCVEPNPDFGKPGSPTFPDNYSQREIQLAVRIGF